MKRQIALDTETTGLSFEMGDRLIEIGLVELIDRKFTGRRFHRYFNPQRSVGAGAIAIHQITDDFLADKPLFSSVIDELIDFIRDSELIIHNSTFDVGFLNFELNRAGHQYKLENYALITDTLAMARQKFPGQRNSLDALCKRFYIDLSSRQTRHGALIDAELLAKAYLAMTGGQLELVPEENISNTESIIYDQPIHTPLQLASLDEINQHQIYLKQLTNPLWLHE